MNDFCNTVSKNKPHICLGSGFWKTDYMRCNLTGGALRSNACEGGKEAGRGRERSRTVLQCQQGAQPVSMEVLLSWAPCRVAVLRSRESVLYIHTGPDLVLGLPLEGEHGVSQVALVVKNTPAHAGDGRGAGSIPGSGRSPG